MLFPILLGRGRFFRIYVTLAGKFRWQILNKLLFFKYVLQVIFSEIYKNNIVRLKMFSIVQVYLRRDVTYINYKPNTNNNF